MTDTAPCALVERLTDSVNECCHIGCTDCALMTEAATALTAALDEIERLHRGFRDMQRGTFYAQDEDGCLRRWFPPALKGDDQ